MTAKAWLIVAIELLLSALVVYVLMGQLKSESKRADDSESLAKQRQDTITDMQTRQRDVAALDAKYTKELADAQAQTTALQRKLDNGGRVRVKGSCPASTTVTTTSPSLGNDGTVELASVAGRNVLSIRYGIQRDQSALRALQEYIIMQCSR